MSRSDSPQSDFSPERHLLKRGEELRSRSRRVPVDGAAIQVGNRDISLGSPLRLLAVVDENWVLQPGTAGWNRALGYEHKHLIGMPFLEFLHPEDRAEVLSDWEHLRDSGRLVKSESRCRHHDGSYRWILWQVRLASEDNCFHAVGHDITERKELEARYEQITGREHAARVQAESALRLREEFLATAAHELKTPLTTLKGYVQLLGRASSTQTIDEAFLAESVQALGAQVYRLETLVNDLLDISRLHEGRLALRLQQIDLVELARQVINRLEQAVERTPAHALVLQSAGPVVGKWDIDRLDQVLSNLLSNALKYSPKGGTVTIRVRGRRETAELAVCDQGIGIPEEEQQRLFEPFARGSGTRGIQGTGLGLYIARGIVVQHGGTILVDSAPYEGSCFTVHLPLNPEYLDGPDHDFRADDQD
jgi:PAS domain S-box-containing protein